VTAPISITGPCAWRGDEMAGSTRWVRILDAAALAEIDAALDRLYRTPKQFGVCEATGQPIPFERLEIVPWARTCDQAGA